MIRLEEYRENVPTDKQRYWQGHMAGITKVFPRLKTRMCAIPYKYGRGEISRLLEKLDKIPNLTQIDRLSASPTI